MSAARLCLRKNIPDTLLIRYEVQQLSALIVIQVGVKPMSLLLITFLAAFNEIGDDGGVGDNIHSHAAAELHTLEYFRNGSDINFADSNTK